MRPIALAVYYSGWGEPFRTGFATAAAKTGGAPLVQIEPGTVPMTQITDGSQDAYLSASEVYWDEAVSGVPIRTAGSTVSSASSRAICSAVLRPSW